MNKTILYIIAKTLDCLNRILRWIVFSVATIITIVIMTVVAVLMLAVYSLDAMNVWAESKFKLKK